MIILSNISNTKTMRVVKYFDNINSYIIIILIAITKIILILTLRDNIISYKLHRKEY